MGRRQHRGAQGTGEEEGLPLTLGLVIHSLADGLALGASALPLSGTDGEGSASSTGLSLIVFLALIIHKGAFFALQIYASGSD